MLFLLFNLKINFNNYIWTEQIFEAMLADKVIMLNDLFHIHMQKKLRMFILLIMFREVERC